MKINVLFILIFVVIFSCKKNTLTKTNLELENLIRQKVFKKSLGSDKKLIQLIKKKNFEDTLSVVLTNEFKIPRNGVLNYDSSYYHIGAYLNVYRGNISIAKDGLLDDFFKKHKPNYRIDLGGEGDPKTAEITEWKFNTSVRYDWILAIDMIASSDNIETTLVGFLNDKSKIIAQEYSMDLDQFVLNDSVLIFNRKLTDTQVGGFVENSDSIRINIYSSEREVIKLKNSSN